MRKIVWTLKQLLPLINWSIYEKGNKRYFTIWKMWFGKYFDKTKFERGLTHFN